MLPGVTKHSYEGTPNHSEKGWVVLYSSVAPGSASMVDAASWNSSTHLGGMDVRLLGGWEGVHLQVGGHTNPHTPRITPDQILENV